MNNGKRSVSTKKKKLIDYFKPAVVAEEDIVRRIKGSYRRQFVSRAMQDEGVDSVSRSVEGP